VELRASGAATGSLGAALSPRLVGAADKLERSALAGVRAHPELRPVLAALDAAHFDSEANRRLRAHLLADAGGDDELTGLLAELDARAEAEAIDETTARELLLRLRERHLRRELPGADGERLKELQAELERVREAAATLV